MNKPSDHPAKIRYKYQMDENARLQTAHGVWGGINPQGEIEMNFYHESDALPAFRAWACVFVAFQAHLQA